MQNSFLESLYQESSTRGLVARSHYFCPWLGKRSALKHWNHITLGYYRGHRQRCLKHHFTPAPRGLVINHTLLLKTKWAKRQFSPHSFSLSSGQPRSTNSVLSLVSHVRVSDTCQDWILECVSLVNCWQDSGVFSLGNTFHLDLLHVHSKPCFRGWLSVGVTIEIITDVYTEEKY